MQVLADSQNLYSPGEYGADQNDTANSEGSVLVYGRKDGKSSVLIYLQEK